MANDGTGSYTLEFKIPLNNVFLDYEDVGHEFGFDVQRIDADDLDMKHNKIYSWWYETNICPNTNPSTFGTAILNPPPCGCERSGPRVFTYAATVMTGTSVNLNGLVNTHWANVKIFFQYGTTTAYGTEIDATPNNLNGSAETKLSAILNGLAPNTTYHYRLVASSTDSVHFYYGSDRTFFTSIEGINEPETNPSNFILSQNFPNPFNSGTMISYDLPKEAQVSLSIYNLEGQPVCQLVQETQPAGRHAINWNGTDQSGRPVGSGVYAYRLDVKGKDASYSAVKKMFLVK
jgi:hypothetical protein